MFIMNSKVYYCWRKKQRSFYLYCERERERVKGSISNLNKNHMKMGEKQEMGGKQNSSLKLNCWRELLFDLFC